MGYVHERQGKLEKRMGGSQKGWLNKRREKKKKKLLKIEKFEKILNLWSKHNRTVYFSPLTHIVLQVCVQMTIEETVKVPV